MHIFEYLNAATLELLIKQNLNNKLSHFIISFIFVQIIIFFLSFSVRCVKKVRTKWAGCEHVLYSK